MEETAAPVYVRQCALAVREVNDAVQDGAGGHGDSGAAGSLQDEDLFVSPNVYRCSESEELRWAKRVHGVRRFFSHPS